MLAVALVALLSAPAAAQQSPAAADQVGMDQISPARAGEPGALVAQIGSREEPSAPTTQLSNGAREVATRQLAPAGQSVAAPPGTSTTRDSRMATASAIGGSDRCDPKAEAARSAVCRRPIESRAGDFPAPAPTPLSPEQRLLVDQQLRAGPSSLAVSTRRAGDAELAPVGNDQAIAATVFANRAAAEAEAAERARQANQPETPNVDQAVLNAIINVAGASTGK